MHCASEIVSREAFDWILSGGADPVFVVDTHMALFLQIKGNWHRVYLVVLYNSHFQTFLATNKAKSGLRKSFNKPYKMVCEEWFPLLPPSNLPGILRGHMVPVENGYSRIPRFTQQSVQRFKIKQFQASLPFQTFLIS